MSGSIQDMNNRVNQNRSLKPSNRARFKDNNRDNIYSDTVPALTKLNFKKVSEIELKKIKDRIKNRALKDRNREMFIFLVIALTLVATLFILFK
ncbi:MULTISPECIES: hypothetical protein [Arenibacter]|uniref:hypothetical protein n=1 Tax=Arenibacter TaxID=178469 RepID=UPI001C07722A|nr:MULTISPECIES: hypothetical protein [Arenibacter]MBU2904821.1 hypothetical protein [Arenibacter algicola]MCK0134668.1 hypothetical protein [Arenibacter sp. S6351L]